MTRVASLAALALCGCFSRPDYLGGDGGTGGDATTSDAPCTLGGWGPLVELTEFRGHVTGEPTITNDRKLMLWSLQTGFSPAVWTVNIATRDTTNEPFAPEPQQVDLDSAELPSDPDPAITDDGLTVVFRGGIAGAPKIRQATRSSHTAPWQAIPVTTLDSADPASLDVSADGLTVYWATGSKVLYSATRSSPTTDDFVIGASLAQNVRWPSISGDELTVYYLSDSDEIWQMTRGAKTSAFSNPMLVLAGGKDPDVTSDGTAIVVGAGGTSISISERTCE